MDILEKAKKDIEVLSREKIPGYSREDLRQEFRLVLWQKRKDYDPRRSSLKTFIDRVLRWKLGKLRRNSWREKRKIAYFTTPFSHLSKKERKKLGLE